MGIDDKVIEASKLRNWEFCPHSFFLDMIIRNNNILMTYYLARKIKLRDYFKALFREQKRLGPEFLHIEDMQPEELVNHLVFRSAETFASSMAGRWKWLRNKNYKVQDRTVVWRTEKEKWSSHKAIHAACFNYYDRIAELGAPVQAYSDSTIPFFFRGQKFNVNVGEFRNNLLVSQNDPKKNVSKRSVANDWYATFQLLAFCRLAHDYEPFRMKMGIDPDLAASWDESTRPVSEDVRYVHFSLSDAKEIETSRTASDVEELMDFVRSTQQQIRNAEASREFEPNHKSCYICKYNVLGADGKAICKESKPGSVPMKPSKVKPSKE